MEVQRDTGILAGRTMTQPQQHYDVTDDDFDFIWKNIDSPLVVRDRINVIKTRSHPYQSERDRVLDEVILRINNLLNGLYEEKRKSFWFRLSQAKSNSPAEFTLRYVADMVKELRRAGG